MAREISTKKKIVFALIVVLAVCLGLEVAGVFHARRREGSFSFLGQRTPLLDFKRIIGNPSHGKNQERYQKVKASYLLFDATLGIRFKPSTWAVALEADEEGKPHIATQRRLAIDPYGFIANVSDPHWARDYKALVNDQNTCRILVSGGSTTAGWGASDNEHTWPAVLERMLRDEPGALGRRFSRVVVINGGVFGYGISQELKRFQEETIYLKPNLVIAFNGMNELWNYRGNPVHYATSSRQNFILRQLEKGQPEQPSLFMPYTFAWLRGGGAEPEAPARRSFGYENPNYISHPGYYLYLSKIAQFRALCESNQIPFVYALQPVMGVGEKPLTEQEEAIKQFMGSEFYRKSWEQYVEEAQSFYRRVRRGLTESWQHDLSGIFDEVDRTIYSDPRHYNDLGNKHIAERVYELIMNQAHRL